MNPEIIKDLVQEKPKLGFVSLVNKQGVVDTSNIVDCERDDCDRSCFDPCDRDPCYEPPDDD